MKRIVTLFAAAASMLLVASCSKPAEETPNTELKVVVNNVSMQTATVEASVSGTAPALIRLTPAIAESVVLETVKSLDDEAAMKAFITRNGSAVSLPYSSVIKDLTPDTWYVVGVIAFNDNMDATACAHFRFKTDEFGSVTVGDPSGAGSVIENVLE